MIGTQAWKEKGCYVEKKEMNRVGECSEICEVESLSERKVVTKRVEDQEVIYSLRVYLSFEQIKEKLRRIEPSYNGFTIQGNSISFCHYNVHTQYLHPECVSNLTEAGVLIRKQDEKLSVLFWPKGRL